MTDQPSSTGEVLVQLAALLRNDQIYGPPVEKGGVTVVPVARVRGGGGLGGEEGREPHQTNRGCGFTSQPAGAWVVTDAGKVQWYPALDVMRLAALGQLVAGLVVLAVLLTRRDRRQAGLSPDSGPRR